MHAVVVVCRGRRRLRRPRLVAWVGFGPCFPIGFEGGERGFCRGLSFPYNLSPFPVLAAKEEEQRDCLSSPSLSLSLSLSPSLPPFQGPLLSEAPSLRLFLADLIWTPGDEGEGGKEKRKFFFWQVGLTIDRLFVWQQQEKPASIAGPSRNFISSSISQAARRAFIFLEEGLLGEEWEREREEGKEELFFSKPAWAARREGEKGRTMAGGRGGVDRRRKGGIALFHLPNGLHATAAAAATLSIFQPFPVRPAASEREKVAGEEKGGNLCRFHPPSIPPPPFPLSPKWPWKTIHKGGREGRRHRGGRGGEKWGMTPPEKCVSWVLLPLPPFHCVPSLPPSLLPPLLSARFRHFPPTSSSSSLKPFLRSFPPHDSRSDHRPHGRCFRNPLPPPKKNFRPYLRCSIPYFCVFPPISSPPLFLLQCFALLFSFVFPPAFPRNSRRKRKISPELQDGGESDLWFSSSFVSQTSFFREWLFSLASLEGHFLARQIPSYPPRSPTTLLRLAFASIAGRRKEGSAKEVMWGKIEHYSEGTSKG